VRLQLLKIISADPRYLSAVFLIEENDFYDRFFPDWGMAFVGEEDILS
jgi:hypothetical protein